MPTITLQVSASTDDARNNSGNGTFNATIVSQHLGTNGGVDYWNGWRWLGVSVPKDALISSAVLDSFCAGGAGSSAPCIFYGEASDNAATFTNSTPGKPEGRTRTTASKTHTFTSAGWASTGFGTNPVDVTNLVQEIVNRSGWVSGNALVIVGHSNGASNNNYYSHSTYDFSGNARGAKLIIDYTTEIPPDAPSSLTAAQDGSAVGLSWSDVSNDVGYEIQRKRGASPNWYPIASPPTDSTSATDADVNSGYTYTYRIRSVGTDGQSAWVESSSVTMSGTKAWTARVSGWIYPGQSDAQAELTDGRVLYSAKPEFATITSIVNDWGTDGDFTVPMGYANMIDDPTMVSRSKAYSAASMSYSERSVQAPLSSTKALSKTLRRSSHSIGASPSIRQLNLEGW